MSRVDTVVDKLVRKRKKRVVKHSTGNSDLEVSSNKKRKTTSKVVGRVSKTGKKKGSIKRVKDSQKSSASNTPGSASNGRRVRSKNTSHNKLKQRVIDGGTMKTSEATFNLCCCRMERSDGQKA